MSDKEAVDDMKKDSSDVDVEAVGSDSEDNPLLAANISLMMSNVYDCEDDDEPWEIKADSTSSDEYDANLPTCSKPFQADNPKTQGMERKILVPKKKFKNSIYVNCKTSGDKELEKLKLKESDLLQTAKKCKYSQGDDAGGIDTNSKCSRINLESNYEMNRMFTSKKQLEVNVKSGKSTEDSKLNKNLDNGQDFSETSRTLSNLPDLISSTNLSHPSCSTDLAGPSSSTGKLQLVSDLPEANMDKKLVSKVLLNICNKLYLNDSSKPMITPKENVEQKQDVSVVPIEKCNCLEGSLANSENSNTKGSDSHIRNSQCFVEDDDFVNPDILYNIDLNEHCKQMELLVQKIVKKTDDQTRSILDECKQLMPIPRIEHEQKTFTERERLNFLNGICEWEYEIDRDDWNKIMVKRAVVFTAHAGFSIANEESLYVLADVAIDYIKKLAIILKRNFDIQSNSSYPDTVDPVINSLKEIGVDGGIGELIKHYENDVYERRNKLTKKCQHLQKIIDQFVERASPIELKIKNQYTVKQEPREESTARDIGVDASQTTTVEGGVRTELQSMADESGFANSEMEQTELVYVDSVDNEADADTKTVENVRDRKTDRARTADVKTRDFDLLKPLTGYVLHEPITLDAADTGRVDRARSNVWESRNESVFDIRDYVSPFNRQILSRSRSFAGRSGSRRAGNGRSCVTVIRPVSSVIAIRRGVRRPVAFRTTMNDLEVRFRHFTCHHGAHNDVPSADHDDCMSSDESAAASVQGGERQGRGLNRRA